MKTPIRLLLAACFVMSHASHAGRAPPDADLLVAWNSRVLAVAESEDRFLTLKGVRTAAMMHLAIHDAINAIDPHYRSYALEMDGRGADPIAAATQAAFLIANDQYPARRDQWESLRRQWLKPLERKSREAGVALGEAAAQAVLEKRAGDHWDTGAVPLAAPACHRQRRLHARLRRSPHRGPLREPRSHGRSDSPGLWWKEFAESSHNRLARQRVSEEALDLWTAARFFALLNVSIMDAYIGVFDNKFFYNHWCPYTAIRWAAHDGNPRTRAEPGWNNTHRHAYAFPSYPSAHGTACAAAMTVFADTFGERRWFRMVTPQVDAGGPLSKKIPMKPATRSFDGFQEAARECGWSRVYLGIHFRYDSIEGIRLGNRIGGYAVRTLARPLQDAP